MILRPRQEEVIKYLRMHIVGGTRRVLLCGPTGFGKTVVIATIAKGHLAAKADNHVLVVVHRRELLKQTRAQLGINDPRVIVTTIQSLMASGERPKATLVIWDEAHHCPAASFAELYAAYPNAIHIGATATPQRADGKPLGNMFDAMVVGASVRELMTEGLLVPSEVIAPSKTIEDALAMDPVEAYQRYTPGRAAVVFGASVAHARELAARFIAAGIHAACVDGDTDLDVRDDVLERFKSGSLDVVTNCFVLTEGFDAPRAEVAILCRLPEHVGTYLQMVGRVLRTREGKTKATVVDLRGAVLLHGLPDEDRRWQLGGKACVRTERIASLQRCTECLAVFRPSRTCPRCGVLKTVIEKLPRVLRRAERLEKWNDVPQHVRDERYLWRLIGVARVRMHKTPDEARYWALKQFRKRFSREPENGAAA